jgi:Flp pilus assembly pilin Flp
MTKALVKTQIRLQQFIANRESGQGTLEYIGMVVVAALLIVGVVTAASTADLGGKFQTAIDKLTSGTP